MFHCCVCVCVTDCRTTMDSLNSEQRERQSRWRRMSQLCGVESEAIARNEGASALRVQLEHLSRQPLPPVRSSGGGALAASSVVSAAGGGGGRHAATASGSLQLPEPSASAMAPRRSGQGASPASPPALLCSALLCSVVQRTPTPLLDFHFHFSVPVPLSRSVPIPIPIPVAICDTSAFSCVSRSYRNAVVLYIQYIYITLVFAYVCYSLHLITPRRAALITVLVCTISGLPAGRRITISDALLSALPYMLMLLVSRPLFVLVLCMIVYSYVLY